MFVHVVINNCYVSCEQLFNPALTVQHTVSEVSHWRTFFIDERYQDKPTAELKKKDTDWHYPFDELI